MDDRIIKEKIEDKTKVISAISVGITWVDGRAIFKQEKDQSNFYFGVCHFSRRVAMITPLDYVKPLMITTIRVSPTEEYCEKAYSCVYFNCFLNKFNKEVFLNEFKDCGAFTLGLPLNFGQTPAWFNDGKWMDFWGKLIIGVEGGVIKFDEEKAKNIS